MSYFGKSVYSQSGALLSKRNYINRKLDEIKQKLIDLGWYVEEAEYENNEGDPYDDIPSESAGALLPYRDKVNKTLDLFEQIIRENTSFVENTQRPMNSYKNPYQVKNKLSDYTPKQQEFQQSAREAISNLFDN